MAAEISLSDCTLDKRIGMDGLMVLTLTTPATADDADYIYIPMAAQGMKTFMKCVGTYQSTADNVSVETAFVTAVTSGTLKVTLDSVAGTDKVRIAVITGRS